MKARDMRLRNLPIFLLALSFMTLEVRASITPLCVQLTKGIAHKWSLKFDERYSLRSKDGSAGSEGSLMAGKVAVMREESLVATTFNSTPFIRFYDLKTGKLNRQVEVKLKGVKIPAKEVPDLGTHVIDRQNNILYVATDDARIFKGSLKDIYKRKPLELVVDLKTTDAPFLKLPKEKEIPGISDSRLRISNMKLSDDGKRFFFSSWEFENKFIWFGVYELEPSQWRFSAAHPKKESQVSRLELQMTNDGKYLMMRTSVPDPEHSAQFAAKNFLPHQPHNIDLNQSLPKKVADLDSGAVFDIVYPSELNSALNTVSRVDIANTPLGLLVLTPTGNAEYVAFIAQTGEIKFRRAISQKFSYPKLSNDGTSLFYHVGAADSGGSKAREVRAISLQDPTFSNIRGFKFDPKSWGSIWTTSDEKFLIDKGLHHLHIYEIAPEK